MRGGDVIGHLTDLLIGRILDTFNNIMRMAAKRLMDMTTGDMNY